jgi:hypothetical protein
MLMGSGNHEGVINTKGKGLGLGQDDALKNLHNIILHSWQELIINWQVTTADLQILSRLFAFESFCIQIT